MLKKKVEKKATITATLISVLITTSGAAVVGVCQHWLGSSTVLLVGTLSHFPCLRSSSMKKTLSLMLEMKKKREERKKKRLAGERIDQT